MITLYVYQASVHHTHQAIGFLCHRLQVVVDSILVADGTWCVGVPLLGAAHMAVVDVLPDEVADIQGHQREAVVPVDLEVIADLGSCLSDVLANLLGVQTVKALLDWNGERGNGLVFQELIRCLGNSNGWGREVGGQSS